MRNHAINPYMAPIVSVMFFFIAFFMPSDIWEQYLNERNYVYLNFTIFFYMLAALQCIYLGIFFGNKVFNSNAKCYAAKSFPAYNMLLLPVIVFSLGIALVYFAYLYFVHDGYVFLVFQGQGAKAKELIAADVVDFSTIVHLLIPSVWWGWYRYAESCRLGLNKQRFIFYILILLTLLVFFILIVMVARYALMPLFFGLFLIFMKFKVYEKNSPKKHFFKSLQYGVLFLLFVLILFSLLALSRGVSGFDDLLAILIGYGPASFNRLALVLEGGLSFPYAETGVYIIPDPFFSLLRSLIGLAPIDSMAVWRSEFSAVSEAGLNQNMIWATQLGYAWNSIYWGAFLYYFFYGFLLSFAYNKFLEGTRFGVIFYPLAFFSVFFLFGSIYFIIFFFYYFLFFVLLFFWEFVVFRMIREVSCG